jgi:hypothetical protein
MGICECKPLPQVPDLDAVVEVEVAVELLVVAAQVEIKSKH